MKNDQKMSTCNQLVLESLDSQWIMSIKSPWTLDRMEGQSDFLAWSPQSGLTLSSFSYPIFSHCKVRRHGLGLDVLLVLPFKYCWLFNDESNLTYVESSTQGKPFEGLSQFYWSHPEDSAPISCHLGCHLGWVYVWHDPRIKPFGGIWWNIAILLDQFSEC